MLAHEARNPIQENKGFKPAKSRTNLDMGKEGDAYVTKGRRINTGGVCLDDGSNDADFGDFDFGYTPVTRDRDPLSFADVTIKVAKPKGTPDLIPLHREVERADSYGLGIRKEYDWVEKVAPVIAMDDELKSVFSEEDWEDIYAEQQALLKPYATAAASSSRTAG